MEKLVTIATFDFPAEAEAGKLFLEQMGIRAFLADDNLVGMDWLYANAVGGVKLQVAASDADRASGILKPYLASKTTPSKEHSGGNVTFACHDCRKNITFSGERCGHVETCPHCGNYGNRSHPGGQ